MKSKIYNGDCLEIMPTIPAKSASLIFADLPYGVTRNEWDEIIPFDKMWDCFFTLLKDDGVTVLTSTQPFTSKLVMSNIENFKYEWIWIKNKGSGFLNVKKQPLRIHESVLVFYKKQPCYNPQMRTGFTPYTNIQICREKRNYGSMKGNVVTVSNGERFPIDVLKFKRASENVHPTQKPVEMLEYLIKTYTNPGDIVVDPCMGSGTTGIACYKTGRAFVGIEKNREYFEIAKERLARPVQVGLV